jgi:hypothetical protein
MTLIVDLREAASIIEADFSHLWVPQDPRCWYRPGAFDPIINPAQQTYFIRIGGEFIAIKEYRELPDTDIYNHQGLVIPRALVSSLSNTCTQPTRGLRLVQAYISKLVLNQLAYKPYVLQDTKDWYAETLLSPEMMDERNIPRSEYDKPADVLWNALNEHWFKITDYLQEITDMVIEFIKVNRWCEYQESYRHHDLVLMRGVDIRLEFFEKYEYLHEQIQDLHRKAEAEKGFTLTRSDK